ncbi:MAG: type II secretion system protein [Planctomycetota bacterium]|jgi:prepilin-type N-terminal cleavage/methylation domain-containing protein
MKEGQMQRKGFTLIELLVVIAIIALLMSILMPALRNVRDQAKDSMCQQRLQQWGVMFNMYSQENDGGMMDWGAYAWAAGKSNQWGELIEHAWVPMMYNYTKSFEIYLCPAATQLWGTGFNAYDPKAAWDFQYIVDGEFSAMDWYWYYAVGTDENPIYSYGSYGKNIFISTNPLPTWQMDSDDDMYWFWPNVRVKGASRIPLFGDCSHMGGLPMIWDEPAATRMHHPWSDDEGGEINRWNLDRHRLSVNLVFLDWSVRKVGLRQLWSLHWTRQKNESGAGWGNLEVVPNWNDPELWPEWMRKSKNYDL